MTSDGIASDDWERVQDFAARIANAVCKDVEAGPIICNLIAYLGGLEGKYGRLPSILATKADYTADITQREGLLLEAYDAAAFIGDKKNATSISSSLAQLFLEELNDIALGEKWLNTFCDALGESWDDCEFHELERLRSVFLKLKSSGNGSSCTGENTRGGGGIV